MDQGLQQKWENLQAILQQMGRVAVAFSGGVDSTFLVKAAQLTSNVEVIAFTAASCFVPPRDVAEAKAFCAKEGIRHIIHEADVLSVKGIRENPKDRCYLCKHALFSFFTELAKKEGNYVLVDGTNVDDDGDYRPGRKALSELGVRSPLHEAGLHKADIRALSHEFGLATWDKPSAACLASRFPYGDTLTQEALARVDRAEVFLHSLGFTQLRVRVHGDLARIELLPDDMKRFADADTRTKIAQYLHDCGFRYAALDLDGYRTGSMNG